MIIFDHPDRFAQFHQSCVATIGKFDGVHLGHQLILDQLKQRAEELNLPTLASPPTSPPYMPQQSRLHTNLMISCPLSESRNFAADSGGLYAR